MERGGIEAELSKLAGEADPSVLAAVLSVDRRFEEYIEVEVEVRGGELV